MSVQTVFRSKRSCGSDGLFVVGNRKVPNPQIALALTRRSLSAQLDIAKAIGATPEPIVADML